MSTLVNDEIGIQPQSDMTLVKSELPHIDFEPVKASELEQDRPFSQKRYLVNGEIREWAGEQVDVETPLDLGRESDVIGSYPALGKREALEMIESASSAYQRGLGVWPQSTPSERVAAVMNFANRMNDVREEVVKRISLEVGKSLGDAETEFDRTVEYIKRSCLEVLTLANESGKIIEEGGVEATVSRESIGTVLCMGPFNYPLNETFATMLPALLMGNTVVMKPPKKGVLLFDPLLDLFKESFPKGVVNVITGDGQEVITPIMESGKVDVLAFIGTPQVADIVAGNHPEPHRLKKILGLGAKNPAVIFSDADLDATIPKAVKGSLSFNGQRCTALKLHFVDRHIAGEYVERFASAVEGLKVGQPWEDDVKITPLAEGPAKIAFLQELIEDAVSKGAQIMNEEGGTVNGNLFTPAVLYPVTSDMRIFKEEQFGPIVPIVPISSPGEAVDYLASLPYGQQVSLFGQDERRLRNMALTAQKLVGRVNLNDECKRGPDILPFTGKRSAAMGTLSIRGALEEFSIESVIAQPSNVREN